MTIQYDIPTHRGLSHGSPSGAVLLEEKFEIIKDIGDGSFGSVTLARVRHGGSHVARRGTMVAIKTMKKTFDSFAPCLDLREVIFLRSLPNHVHLVPALDIFLDPLSKKLHIAMEYMDGNLYQLMKSREGKPFDGSSVKSILFQILGGLEHIHHHNFFHRDIKPENILVSMSNKDDFGGAFKRYSQLVTPPSTPPSYSIKIADFGLAREIHSKSPYTTYVSTRWYRAPEVLLRAGEYSAPVDIWAIGAMAVEIATLKPLFPGGNEVDQVWRVCEIMGSPGNWVNKHNQKVGGGEWKEGIKLAQKLGFSFPKMAPHPLDTFLPAPQWPPALANFVTWCLLWDPKKRPTSTQSLQHEYFADAHDPLRPKSRSGLLGRKQSDLVPGSSHSHDSNTQPLTTKTSWFRRSLVARDSAPAVPQVSQYHQQQTTPVVAQPSPMQPVYDPTVAPHHLKNDVTAAPRPQVSKRATWTNGTAPMPVLPSIRPISPLSSTVTAKAQNSNVDSGPKKIGRQLSMASNGNHYPELHRQEAEKALNGQNGVMSPTSSQQQKESFFSHLRKRARRLSGRNQLPVAHKVDEEAGYAPGVHGSNRNSMMVDSGNNQESGVGANMSELDKALQSVRYSIDETMQAPAPAVVHQPMPVNPAQHHITSQHVLKRHHSIGSTQESGMALNNSGRKSPGLAGMLNRRSMRRVSQKPILPENKYETPDEQEELLDEALTNANAAISRMNHEHRNSHKLRQAHSEMALPGPYPTPSPTDKRNSQLPSHLSNQVPSQMPTHSTPINIKPATKAVHSTEQYPFPTPPYDENEWAAAAAASIFAAGDNWR